MVAREPFTSIEPGQAEEPVVDRCEVPPGGGLGGCHRRGVVRLTGARCAGPFTDRRGGARRDDGHVRPIRGEEDVGEGRVTKLGVRQHPEDL